MALASGFAAESRDSGNGESRPGDKDSGTPLEAWFAADPDLHVVAQSIEEMHERESAISNWELAKTADLTTDCTDNTDFRIGQAARRE